LSLCQVFRGTKEGKGTIRVKGLQQIDDPLFPCEQMVGDGQTVAQRIPELTIPLSGKLGERGMATGNQTCQNSGDVCNLVWSEWKTIVDIPIGSNQRKIAGQGGREFLFRHKSPIDVAFLLIPMFDSQLFTGLFVAQVRCSASPIVPRHAPGHEDGP
jgi:hypothetical protein